MKQINISQVDALFSRGNYAIEFLLYYKEGFDTQKIRRALQRLSSVFWPMFGEYRDGIIFFDRYSEEDCFEEEIVGQELDIPKLKENGSALCSQFCQPDLKKLFFLKAIKMKNGLILVPKMNHLAGDGYSYFYFLSVLAALSKQPSFSIRSSLFNLFFKPHHRRTALKNFSFKGVELKPEHQHDTFTIEYEEILREDVQSAIKEVAVSDNFRISKNDILSAVALKKLVGIQSGFFGEEIELTIPIDVRRKIKEYGLRFFGNGIMLHTIQLKKKHIENSPLKELAVEIRKSMPLVSKETYINYLIGLEKTLSERKMDKFRPFDPKYGCLVTNIAKLPSDKLNFGSGSPELILPLTVENNSVAILANKENFILRFAHNP